MTFRDHFSGHADDYASYRPRYPSGLYEWLATGGTGRCWDCATGNGQAAVGLANAGFEVFATDASATQISAAEPHPRVRYGVAPAHGSGLPDRSVELVTVAQALHWFDFPPFFAEVERVLVPGGRVVAWCYELFAIEPAVDAVVAHLYDDLVGGDWPPERRHIESGYRTVPWPWDRAEVPEIAMEASWSVEQTLGYLRTWSAVRRAWAREGTDPVLRIEADLREAWGERPVRTASWPLSIVASQPR